MSAPTRRRRLLLASSNINTLGGMETQLLHLASGLARQGNQVRLVSIRSTAGERELAAALDDRVELIHLGAQTRERQLAAMLRLRRMARDSDLVHCTGWDASLWGRLAAIGARRPVIVAEHTPGREHQVSPTGAPRGRYIAVHNRLLDRFTATTVICAEWQRGLLRGEGVAAQKLVLIPNGVPVDELRGQAQRGPTRADLGIPDEALLIVHVARFTPQKRQLLALETAARLRESLGDVRILFAGDGPDLDHVMTAARQRGADWAVFLGRHDNVPALFAMSDLTILPSAGEAMPMTIVEAIALGVPVVATDVGDVGNLIERTGAGLLVPVNDEEAVFRACLRVLADENERRRLTASADAARAEVDAETMVRRYIALFDAILAGPRGKRPGIDTATGDRMG